MNVLSIRGKRFTLCQSKSICFDKGALFSLGNLVRLGGGVGKDENCLRRKSIKKGHPVSLKSSLLILKITFWQFQTVLAFFSPNCSSPLEFTLITNLSVSINDLHSSVTHKSGAH